MFDTCRCVKSISCVKSIIGYVITVSFHCTDSYLSVCIGVWSYYH